MAVEAKITGNGAYAGNNSALSNYSALEDATALNPADTSGGVGQLSFSVVEARDGISTFSLMGDTIALSDGANGTVVGTVTGVAVTDGNAEITADSRLGLLLANKTAQPQYDTAANIIRYYLGLGGITSGLVIDPSFNSSTLYSVQGWTGTVWDYIKQFLLTLDAEIALVSNNVVVRPIRGRVAINKRNISEQVTLRRGNLAQNIEINYYQNNYQINGQIYPVGGIWDDTVQVYQVDAGERLVVNIPLNASISSVSDPVCVSFVGRYDTGNLYSVIGADGLPIPPTQWTQSGGNVTVAVGEDTKSVDVTIYGAITTQAPYRIAVASSASDTYSSLRLAGTGVFFEPTTLRIATGASPNETVQTVGLSVDNQFVSTIDQAWSYGLRAAAAYGGYEQSLSVSTIGINRVDDNGSALYPTFDQFTTGLNAAGVDAPSWAGKTFNQFNTTWAGQTFDQFNAYYYSFVDNVFANQAFGNVAGARVLTKNAWYRISTATITPTGVSYTGLPDTLFSDFTETWTKQSAENPINPSGGTGVMTYNDFNLIQSGRSFNDFNATPVWRTYAGLSPAKS